MVRIFRVAFIAAIVLSASSALAVRPGKIAPRGAAAKAGEDKPAGAAKPADNGGWPANVTKVISEKGKTVTASGKLERGERINDLTWASTSSMACFPATQNEKFRGNHVLFATDLPQRSILVVTVVPKDPSKDVSIWGYQVGTTNFRVPPTIESCTSCEAEHKWDRPKRGKTQDHTRSITFNATTNPYNILIGVSGPGAATAGDFDLKFELK